MADWSGFHSSYEIGRRQRKYLICNAREIRKLVLETSKLQIRRHYLDSVSCVLSHFLTLRLFENLAHVQERLKNVLSKNERYCFYFIRAIMLFGDLSNRNTGRINISDYKNIFPNI